MDGSVARLGVRLGLGIELELGLRVERGALILNDVMPGLRLPGT